mmetsp:Transcript_6330/g.22562  ORF Transcript_6330/g.22562 Transcript_6330/m.22562 type:complete len:254 (+) Transcript_6330:2-763(+)
MQMSTCRISAAPMKRFLSRSMKRKASSISLSPNSSLTPSAPDTLTPRRRSSSAICSASARFAAASLAARTSRSESSKDVMSSRRCGYGTPGGPTKSRMMCTSPRFSTRPHLERVAISTQPSCQPFLKTGSSDTVVRPMRSSSPTVSLSMTSIWISWWSTMSNSSFSSHLGAVPPSVSTRVCCRNDRTSPSSVKTMYGSWRPMRSVSARPRPATAVTSSLPAGKNCTPSRTSPAGLPFFCVSVTQISLASKSCR